MVTKEDALLYLLEVDKKLADDLGETSLASKIVSAARPSYTSSATGDELALDLDEITRIAQG